MSNDVNYFEIGSPNTQAARAFYGGLFGWTFGEPSMPARYSMIENDKGGLWDTSAMGGTSWAIFYVQVDNVQAALDRAQELGATVAVPLVFSELELFMSFPSSVAVSRMRGGWR